MQKILYTSKPDNHAFVGGSAADWLSPEDAAVSDAIKRRALELREPARGHFTCYWEGHTHEFDLIVIPNMDSSGDILNLTCVSFDITGSDWLRTIGYLASQSHLLKRLLEEGGATEGLPLDISGPSGPPSTLPIHPEPYRLGALLLDNAIRGLHGPIEDVHLGRTEWLVLEQLIENRGRVVTQKQLLERVWGSGYDGETSLLHDTVSRLRHRLRAAGATFDHIETVHGIGYRFIEQPG